MPGLLEPQLVQGLLFWLEQRPQEEGRTTLMVRSGSDQPAQELTPAPWNLRARVHTYGGGACSIGPLEDGQLAVVFVDAAGGQLWHLSLDRQGRPQGPPLPLTEPEGAEAAFGGGIIDGPRRRWIGIREQGGRDSLVAVALREPLSEAPTMPSSLPPVQVLHQALDFCGYPALSPRGLQLAWVEWQQPFMPWDRSQLWLAPVQADGSLAPAQMVAGSNNGDDQGVAVFQPLWLTGEASGDLVVACDRSGWWNLDRLVDAEGGAARQGWEALAPMEADLAPPQWVFGMRSIAWDGHRLLALACQGGRWQLGEVSLAQSPGTPPWIPRDLPFDDLEGLAAETAGRCWWPAKPAHPPACWRSISPAAAGSTAPPRTLPCQEISSPGQRQFTSRATAMPRPTPGTTPRAVVAIPRRRC